MYDKAYYRNSDNNNIHYIAQQRNNQWQGHIEMLNNFVFSGTC